jgi:putative membrane protein
MGQFAKKNGGSDGVRLFGQMLVTDHTAANEKAKSLAQTQGVTPPTLPKPDAKKEFDRLSKLNGEAFDKEFAKHMVADHKKDIAEFEAQAKSTDDVASFAKDTLPTLQNHLQTAQSLTSGKSAQQ